LFGDAAQVSVVAIALDGASACLHAFDRLDRSLKMFLVDTNNRSEQDLMSRSRPPF